MSKALIIGGGIAGPVTAMALRRAGVDSVIYEAYPHGADNAGVFLTLASNGMDALRVLDIHRPVLELGIPTPRISFQSGTGKHLGELPIGGALADGTVSHTIKRADLYRILRDEAVRRGARIEHGKRLVTAETTSGGSVVATFEDGSRATGDLLIGCDGVRSRTRQIIDPAAPKGRYIPLLNVGGYARCPAVAAEPGVFHMVFGKRAFFGYTMSSAGEIWWFANPPRAAEPSSKDLAAVTTEQWRALLIDLFRGDATPAAEIIRATEGELSGFSTYDMPPVRTWHRGHMIIVGDAAHATSPSAGQGASMAIEDGIVLARCLRDLPDVPRAFAAYEGLRRARVERIVAFGERSSSRKVAGPITRVLRDLLLPGFLRRAARESQEWMYGYHIDWDERTTLDGKESTTQAAPCAT